MKIKNSIYAFGIVLLLLSVSSLRAQTYFSDDFENGKAKWIIGGGNWDTLSSTYSSSNHCLTDSRTGNYTYNSDPTVTLAQSINLSGTTSPVLSFYHRYDLAYPICNYTQYYDYIYLEISSNGGFSWSQIKVWTGGNRAWTHEQFTLSNYKYNLVKFRFRLSSHNGCSSVADGWYIDDVKVQEFISTNPTFVFPFSDNFENGKYNWFLGGFNWDTSKVNPNSGMFCLTDSKSGNYAWNSDPIIVMSGVLNLSKTNFPVLTFYHRYSLASPICNYTQYYDYIYLDVSTNGGFTWVALPPQPPLNQPPWHGSNNTWTSEQFDLSNYKSDKVKIRYRISSHNGCGSSADGASFDDVSIYDFNPAYINLNLKLLFEGMFDSGANEMAIQDTVTVFLRNAASPYTIKDTAKGVISPFTLSGQFYFHKPHTGNYYIVVNHRNTIVTWSKNGGVYLVKGDGSVNNYDFTTSASQAYGNNQILKGTKYCIYSGDVNQDGIVDASDVGLIDNDASIGATGYLNNDLTGDSYVDGSDLSIADNNATNFITASRP
ncbi:MAG: hypothetical protein HGGPFJEG_01175 [Ignavibacteria bacterium]|nr:hypothetical protein [Ignavibacteria bacterium]